MTVTSENVFIIAEVGSVHDGSFGNAIKLIEAAANCGADAIKFQTHIPEAETTRDAPSPGYFTAEDRFSYFRRTGFTLDQWKALKMHCNTVGIMFLSSPFSNQAVDLLSELEMEVYKIPSGEVTNIPMLKKIAALDKPVFLSSGMSNWAEIDAAMAALEAVKSKLHLLQCSSMYPCKDEFVGLNVMLEMKQRYAVQVGFSDHTTDSYAILAAVSLGATVVEKHFTFSKLMYGSDAQHSMEPKEFSKLVDDIRGIERIMKSPVNKDNIHSYENMKNIFEKSLVASRSLTRGETLLTTDIDIKKPGTGIPAADFDRYVGRILANTVEEDQLFSESDFL